MGAVRALLVAHVQTAFNAGLRSAGVAVAALALLVLTLFVLSFGLLVGAGGFLAGLVLAPRVAAGDVALAGGLFTAATLGAPFLSLLSGEGRELDWERFRLFPVPGAALFLAELVAMLGDPIMAVIVIGQLALGVGLVVGEAGLWPAALLAAATGVVAQAALRLVMASVVARLLARFRLALVILLSVLPLAVSGWVTLGAPERPAPAQGAQAANGNPAADEREARAARLAMAERMEEVLHLARAVGASLPSSLQLGAYAAARGGRLQDAAAGALAPVALALLLCALAVRGVLGEASGVARTRRGGKERLWSFRSKVWGVARLQLVALFDCQLARFTLVLPFLWVLPVTLGSAFDPAARPEAVGLFVWAFVPTTTAGFLLNQFGLDRGAVKGLFLLPISDEVILKGKALGLALFQGLQLALVSAVLALLLRAPWHVAVAGPFAALFVFLVLLTIGQWTSALWPRPIPRVGLKQAQAGFVFGMVSLAALVGALAPLAGVWALVSWKAKWALPLAMLALDGLALLVHWRFAREAARMLALKRENVVEALG